MRFATPVFTILDWSDFGRTSDGAIVCCRKGLKTRFRGTHISGRRMVICFSTTHVRGAIKSPASTPSLTIEHLFRTHKVTVGKPIWWWLEFLQ